MTTQHIVVGGEKSPGRDVGKQHAANLRNLLCLSPAQQVIVSKGRTQAADTSHLGHASGQSGASTQQETRSRGCPRARKSFFPSARLRSSQLAAVRSKKKLSMLKSPSRKSRSTQANTSKTSGRAQGAFGAVPALFLSRSQYWPLSRPLPAALCAIGGAA